MQVLLQRGSYSGVARVQVSRFGSRGFSFGSNELVWLRVRVSVRDTSILVRSKAVNRKTVRVNGPSWSNGSDGSDHSVNSASQLGQLS
ncbi:hypothetical protein Hdeb2414_s0003g00098061 [Helianthus debilis subsp. tardiflorus]